MSIDVPLFRDKNTPEFMGGVANLAPPPGASSQVPPDDDDNAVRGTGHAVGDCGWLTGLSESEAVKGLKGLPAKSEIDDMGAETPHVHMDAMAFGMGICCLQVTFQASKSRLRFHVLGEPVQVCDRFVTAVNDAMPFTLEDFPSVKVVGKVVVVAFAPFWGTLTSTHHCRYPAKLSAWSMTRSVILDFSRPASSLCFTHFTRDGSRLGAGGERLPAHGVCQMFSL